VDWPVRIPRRKGVRAVYLGRFVVFVPRYIYCVPRGGVSFRRMRFIGVYNCECVGQ